MRTAQELYDHVVRALIAQGEQCLSAELDEDGDVFCLYVRADGAKCAAGHCIPEGMAAQEGRPWRIQGHDLIDAVGHERLVRNMQMAHDEASESTAEWREKFLGRFREAAMYQDLDRAVLGEVPESWRGET